MDEWTFHKIEHTDNLFLRAVGNLCGSISHWFLGVYLRWGTTYGVDPEQLEFDFEED